MYTGYRDKEKRIAYLKKYKATREYRKWSREYMRDYMRKYRPALPNGELRGTCGIGRKYEKIALSLLKGAIDRNAESFRGEWDIEWNGLRIDVKMRNLNKRGTWHFKTKSNPVSDYYLCFCVSNEIVEKIYFFPADVFKTSINVRRNKNRDKYLLVFSEANVKQTTSRSSK